MSLQFAKAGSPNLVSDRNSKPFNSNLFFDLTIKHLGWYRLRVSASPTYNRTQVNRGG